MTQDKSNIVVQTNRFQTPVTQEFLDSMPDEVRTQFMDCITNIPFVKHMVGTERKRACELPRDSEGKIIIDITQPHILENMDYFRPAAKFYEENGCYTLLKPNKAKGSEFQKWFKEEKRRCLEGYVRESDGEWVTGYMYFYLNYAIIKLNRQSERTGVWHQVESLPDFWEGVYYGFHAAHQARMRGLHLIELARRGASKSYRIASMLTHNLLLGEDTDSVRAVNSILTAYLKEYLGDKDGTLSKFDIMRTFLAQTTEFKRTMLRASPSDMSWRQGYKDASGIIHSNDNIVVGLSIKDDMRKIRGKRGMIFFEEMGAFPGLRDVYSNVMDSVKDGDNVFSFLYLVGTAGDKDSDFSGAKTLLYNPDKFGLIAFDNVWDFPGKGTSKFGFFFPAYISRSGCMDENGNSDVTKAIRNILMERWTVKQSGDMDAYLKRVAETCITPAEAILKVKHSYFPVNELNERIRQLDTDHHAYDDVYIGMLMETPQGVVFKATDDIPIRKYNVDNDTPGALEIFEMPVLGREGKPMQNRYILGADPADNDSAESSSLYSIFVLDLLTDKIVAEYTGRRPYADQNHQMAYLLCRYYNGTLMYEANRKGLYSYFAKKHATWMLADCPEYLRAKSLIKYSPFGSAQKGISVNAGVNSFADELIDSWLKKAYIIDVKDDHGERHQEEIPMLYTLRNRALLEELVAYEPDLRKKNVDRIRALSQVMLYREQFIILYGGVDAYMDETPSTAEDEFFDRDWNEHQSKQNRNAWRSIGDFIGQNSK